MVGTALEAGRAIVNLGGVAVAAVTVIARAMMAALVAATKVTA